MGDPWGIVLVPAEGDPCGLLAEGSCGARPPVVVRAGVWVPGTHTRAGSLGALPLWWDGALVPEGWDRARRVAGDLEQSVLGEEDFIELIFIVADPDPGLADVVSLAKYLVSAGHASRVVLLDLVNGRLVERQLEGGT